MTTFLVSDTHLWVNDSGLNLTDWIDHGPPSLGYPRATEVNISYPVDQWNAIVGPNDTVYHLGDAFWWVRSNQEEWNQRLANLFTHYNGKKILIRGNHDTLGDDEYCSRFGFDMVVPFLELENGVILSHAPISKKYARFHYIGGDAYDMESFDYTKYQLNIHGHLHRKGRATKFDDSEFLMKHYCVHNMPTPLENVINEMKEAA